VNERERRTTRLAGDRYDRTALAGVVGLAALALALGVDTWWMLAAAAVIAAGVLWRRGGGR
jgi:fatty acid desaturase